MISRGSRSLGAPALLALAACSSATPAGGGTPDAARDAKPDVDAAPPDALGPYRHTIAIDGTDDFGVNERFATTSASFAARVTWDADNIYVGYMGPDLDPATQNAAQKWLFVYLDVDPGTANGAPTSLTYNTQGATFPTGFGADFYVRRKSDGSLLALEQFQSGTTWTTHATVLPFARGGTYVELAIPRAAIGTSDKVGLVAWMINETQNLEGTFAGLYADNFVDGYAANLALAKYLEIDFTARRDPNDAANQAP